MLAFTFGRTRASTGMPNFALDLSLVECLKLFDLDLGCHKLHQPSELRYLFTS